MRRLPVFPALLAAAPALADPQARVIPYVEVAQGLDADLSADDTVTYTELAAGVDASVQTARVSAQADARYEHDYRGSRRPRVKCRWRRSPSATTC